MPPHFSPAVSVSMTGAPSCPPFYELLFLSHMGSWGRIWWHTGGGPAVPTTPRQTAHAAFICVNGGNSLLVPSFCPSSVGPHLTPKEEVTPIELVSSATDSDQRQSVTLAHLPVLPLPHLQLLLL